MTPNNAPILFFTPDSPSALWQDKPQIARRLARRHTVVMAGPELHLRALPRQLGQGHWSLPDLWRPALTAVDLDDAGLVDKDARSGHLYHFRWSPWTPITGAQRLGSWTAQQRRRRWQTALHSLDAGLPILWLFRPGQQHLIEDLDPQLVVYHVVDEYSSYPGLSEAQAARQRELDRQLTARADLVLCTARSLVEARRPINPNTHYSPNAVDYRAFQKALANPSPPRFLASLSRPLLGVVGGINAKLDLDLLIQVAESRPDWSLALIGPLGYGLQRDQLARLRSLPNVLLPGSVSPDQVPATMAALDACLIPYRLTEQTRHVNPLKFYEYLAAARPIVATSLPELIQYPAVAHLAAEPTAFIAAIEKALSTTGDPVAQATRRAFAAANTWDQRVAAMEALLKATLAKRA